MVKLLVIEDDKVDQTAFLHTLKAANPRCDCRAVFSKAEARSMLRAEHFDIVVADYRLTDGVALDLLPDCGAAPMIIVTGMGDEEIAVRALKAGVYDYLVKDQDRNYLKVLPLTVENAFRRQQLETDEQEQRALATALRDTAFALNSTLELNEVLERILSSARKVVPHDRANIMLIEAGMARIVQSSAGYPALASAMSCPVASRPHFHQMIHTRQPYLLSSATSTPYPIYAPEIDNPASYLAAPLIADDEVIGFINLDSWTKNHFVPVYAERLEAFAAQAAVALENARLYRHAGELAALQERQQIARDLHDSVSQTLFSASVIADSLLPLWQQNPAQIEPELLELRNLVRGALAEMRTLLFELRPDMLATADLYHLLHQLITTLRGRSRIEVVFNSTAQESALPVPPGVKVAVFRIAQEALNNVVKHARARQVVIEFNVGASLYLSIRDDGRGFDMNQVPPGRMGLRMMRERAQTARVEYMVRSAPGEGTQVIIHWRSEQETNS